jgi:steroid delta-isomerase-like uncharacterized protein
MSTTLSPPGTPPGPEGEKQLNTMFLAAFPDAHLTVEDELAERNIVAARWTYQGTHKGEFMGMPTTGRQVSVKGMNFFRIVDGKIVENWSSFDMLSLLQQLGVIPAME